MKKKMKLMMKVLILKNYTTQIKQEAWKHSFNKDLNQQVIDLEWIASKDYKKMQNGKKISWQAQVCSDFPELKETKITRKLE